MGSAFGMGGLSSRIHRHLRRNKKLHWHIDKITSNNCCTVYGVAVLPNEKSECIISAKLKGMKGLISIYGFGNSDCKRNCGSHFFQMESWIFEGNLGKIHFNEK